MDEVPTDDESTKVRQYRGRLGWSRTSLLPADRAWPLPLLLLLLFPLPDGVPVGRREVEVVETTDGEP